MSDGPAKVAIVTGGGIGRGCAIDLARHGFDIVLIDLIEVDLAHTAAEFRELDRKALTFLADVSDHARAAEIVAEIDREWGRIDVLFNNAGRSNSNGMEEISEQEFDDTIAINLKGDKPCLAHGRSLSCGARACAHSYDGSSAITRSLTTSYNRLSSIFWRWRRLGWPDAACRRTITLQSLSQWPFRRLQDRYCRATQLHLA